MVDQTRAQNVFTPDIAYPLPPMNFREYPDGIEVYARFMGQLRALAGQGGTEEIRVLRALQATADLTGRDDSEVAQILVALGLRGPRACFPAGYLNMIERAEERAMPGIRWHAAFIPAPARIH